MQEKVVIQRLIEEIKILTEENKDLRERIKNLEKISKDHQKLVGELIMKNKGLEDEKKGHNRKKNVGL